METKKVYSVYFAPASLLGGCAGTSHWEIETSPNTTTTEGLLTKEEAEEYCRTHKMSPWEGFLIAKDRRVFDALKALKGTE